MPGRSERRVNRRMAAAVLVVCGCFAAGAQAADRPQWGEALTRNMVSVETGLPAAFGTNTSIRWSVPLGTQTYATPVVAGGRVFIGTNNDVPRDPAHAGDRGILLCLAEADGQLLWQLVVPKLAGDIYLDWPRTGLSSPPTVAGRYVYMVSNRGEVMALDAEGLANGNDGPFRDEAALLTPPGGAPEPQGPGDADIVWITDLVREAGIYTHDGAHSSILVDGPLLYLNTGNGVDNTHKTIRRPEAPGLVVLEAATGRIVARDREPIAPATVHAQWSSPALATIGGRRLAVLAGANGIVYAFEALAGVPADAAPVTLRKAWWFDADPTAPKLQAAARNGDRAPGGPSTFHGMPVLVDGRVYVAGGGDLWWGKREAWLLCLDAGGQGDVTAGAQRWRYPLKQHVLGTPAVHGGLVYLADTGRALHAVDAATGQAVWVQDLDGDVWGSPLVADGKVYIGTRKGTLYAMAAGREKRLLCAARLDSPISGTPVAANGTLYVATMKELYAWQTK